MNLARIIGYLRDHLKTLVRISYVVLLILVVVDAIPGLVDKEHAHTKAEHFPAFWSVFGFLGCVLIILASKFFGHRGIMTREDYYDK